MLGKILNRAYEAQAGKETMAPSPFSAHAEILKKKHDYFHTLWLHPTTLITCLNTDLINNHMN